MASQTTLNQISIRTTLEPGDIGYVTHMHGKLYHQEFNYGIGFEAYVAQGLYEFYNNYDPLLDAVWLAEHEGKIVGFLLLMHRDVAEAQLRYFIIDPGYRGLGLGSKLARLFLEHLSAQNYHKSYLWTTNELFTAARIYQKMGFQLKEEKHSRAFGKPLREQRYDLDLKNINEQNQ